MSRLYRLQEGISPCRSCKSVPDLYERGDDGTVCIVCSCGKRGQSDDTITAAMLVWNHEQNGELVETVPIEMNGTIEELIVRLRGLEAAIRKDPHVYGAINIINCNTINVQVCCKVLTDEELEQNRKMAKESEEIGKAFSKTVRAMWNVNQCQPHSRRKPQA